MLRRIAERLYRAACPANRPGRVAQAAPPLPPAPSNGIVELRACLSEDGRTSTIVGVNGSGRVVYTTTFARSRDAA